MTNDPANPEEPKEPRIPKIGCGKLVVFSVGVCVAAGAVGLAFGLLAAIGYYLEMDTMLLLGTNRATQPARVSLVVPSMVFGGGSGVLAGVLWCGIMILRVLPKPPPRGIALPGLLWGLVVGVMSTCILHLGLKMMIPPDVRSLLHIGLLFGVPTGMIMGLICGAILRKLAPRPLE